MKTFTLTVVNVLFYFSNRQLISSLFSFLLLIPVLSATNLNSCPDIGMLSSANTICAGDTTTSLTASNLVNMGFDYGIEFVYFTSAQSGTSMYNTPAGSLGVVPNTNLTGSGTSATLSDVEYPTTAGTYYLYAITDPIDADVSCRPFAATVITIEAAPTVLPITDQVVCAGTSTNAISFSGSSPTTLFHWFNNETAIGLTSSGSGVTSIASFTALNSGTDPLVATITVIPEDGGCLGAAEDFTITVNHLPTVNPILDQIVCPGDLTDPILFTGSGSGLSFNWTNSNVSIGLGGSASGVGSIPAFTAANSNSTVTASGTITVEPEANGCTGNATSFAIFVNPMPDISIGSYSDPSTCGANDGTIEITGLEYGSAYILRYQKDGTHTSVPITGTGSGIFLMTDLSEAAYDEIEVISVDTECISNQISQTLSDPSLPTVAAISDQTICAGESINTISFSGSTGATFDWVNNNPAIGLAGSGSSVLSIASFTATNASASSITGTITVIPRNGACIGNPVDFSITVNPQPTSATFMGTTSIVQGQSTNIYADIVGGTSPYKLIHSNGTQNVTENLYTSGSNISVSPQATTTYNIVSVTDANGCIGINNTGAVEVTVLDGPGYCIIDRVITDNISSVTYIAKKTIQTSGIVTVTPDATYKAGKSITLNSGFSVAPGSSFLAMIENCSPLQEDTETLEVFKPSENIAPTQNLFQEENLDLKIIPNPLNIETSFVFSLANESRVSIELFNVNGQAIESVIRNEWLSEGQHKIRYNAQHLKNGMYYVVIKSGKQIVSKKMFLLN